jgi:putative ABC transport system permease protein
MPPSLFPFSRGPSMDAFWKDVRYGWRVLERSPSFALVAALTLAIGIGANAAIFSTVDALLLQKLPYANPNRIVFVWNTDPGRKVLRGMVSPAEFLDWRDMNHVFQSLAAWRPSYVTITGGGDPEQVWSSHVTGNFFSLFGVQPIVGRNFLPAEEQPGHERVVMISYALWERRFGNDSGIVGRSILLDQVPYQVVGVLPRGFSLFGTTAALDVWVPFAFNRAQLDREDYELVAFGKLKAGVRVPQAQADMGTIIAALKKQYPQVDQKMGIRVVQFERDLTNRVRPTLLIFLAAVALVFLIACANVANLMLARAASRDREIALRATLGAGRWRILSQLLTESVLLAGIGGALGVIVAFGGIRFIRAALPGGTHEIPHTSSIQLNGSVLAFTVGLSLLAGIIFGLAPSIQISRSELGESLKEGSRGSTGGRRSNALRSGLIVSEIALSILLLIGAGLLIRSFVRLMSEDLGFNPSNLLTMQIWLPDNRYTANSQVTNFYEQVLERANAIPGVHVASAVNFLPFSGYADYCDFDIAGRTPPAGEEFTSRYRVMDWRFIPAMGMRIASGRDFIPSDGPDSPGVVLINEELARRYWAHQDPLGQQMRIHVPQTLASWEAQRREGWLTIVGVVGDIREWDWGLEKLPSIYLPYEQNPSRLMSVVIRENGNVGQIVPAVRHIVAGLDANQPVTNVRMMEGLLDDSLAQRRLSMALLAVFAGIAVLLAAVGIYGVMAYVVTQRTHEIGIRMALGAEPKHVLRMVVREAMSLAGIGLAIGLVSAGLLVRYLESQLYGIRAVDPATFVVVAVVIAGVAAAAAYVPARRATRVDPLVALRYE